jgi:hypothetical protein
MKRLIVGFGLLGLVGCFLPLAAGVSLIDFRHFEAWPIYLIVAAFVVPVIAGLDDKLTPLRCLAALIGFGYVAVKFNTGIWDLVVHADIGGKMMGVGAIGGLLASLGGFAEARDA